MSLKYLTVSEETHHRLIVLKLVKRHKTMDETIKNLLRENETAQKLPETTGKNEKKSS
jgi:hypothetical protein